MSNTTIYKQLYKVNKLATKRDPNYDSNRMIKIIGYVFMGLMLLFFGTITTLLILNRPETYEEASPILNIVNLGLGVVLLYELFLRAMIALNKPAPNPVAFYILPIKKRKVILFRQLYTAFGLISLMIALFYYPFFCMISYLYTGGIGVIQSTILLLFIWILNRQIFDLLSALFKKHKIIMVLIIIAYALILLSPLLFSNTVYSENLIFYTLIPYHSFFTISLIAIGLIIALLMYINNCLISNLTLDDLEVNNTVSKLTIIDKITTNLGQLGLYLKNDLKLILRTKQLKIAIIFVLLFPSFQLFLDSLSSKNLEIDTNYSSFIFLYTFLMFPMSIFPYESFHLTFYHSRINNFKYNLWSKWLINAIAVLIGFIPYFSLFIYQGYNIIPLLALYINGIGMLGVSLLFYYAYNTISVNPYKKSRNTTSFNGMMLLFYIVLPVVSLIILFIFETLFEERGYYIIIVLNIITLAFFPLLIKKVEKIIAKRKYITIEKIANT